MKRQLFFVDSLNYSWHFNRSTDYVKMYTVKESCKDEEIYNIVCFVTRTQGRMSKSQVSFIAETPATLIQDLIWIFVPQNSPTTEKLLCHLLLNLLTFKGFMKIARFIINLELQEQKLLITLGASAVWKIIM